MPVLASILFLIISSAVLCGIFTSIEIPMLQRLKAGQNIREEGPQAHLAKAGTPTMGGIAMILTFTIECIIFGIVQPHKAETIIIILLVTLAYAGIGFYDDYLKIVKHQNEGLTSKQKIVLQFAVGLAFALYRYFSGNTSVFVPGVHHPVDFGIGIIPFALFVFVAMTNAVNLTDGLDGLAGSVTMNASAFLGVITYAGISHTDPQTGVTTGFAGNTTSSALAFVLCGCCIGFLFFNRHPAKVFMGDTGSLALGACLSGVAMTSGFDFALPIVGLIYVIEALSVIIQVVVFKTQNGRRFFRMAPIHHHFELGGWSEVKVDTVFCIVTVIMGIVCILIF